MVPILTALKFVRDVGSVAFHQTRLRKGVPMRHKAHRFWLLCITMLETLWAIGASYAAGCLPT